MSETQGGQEPRRRLARAVYRRGERRPEGYVQYAYVRAGAKGTGRVLDWGGITRVQFWPWSARSKSGVWEHLLSIAQANGYELVGTPPNGEE